MCVCFHGRRPVLIRDKKTTKHLAVSNKRVTFALAIEKNALLAQLVEQLTLNQWVQGSNP